VIGWAAGGVDALAMTRIAVLTAAFLLGAYVIGRPLVWGCMRVARERLRLHSAELAMMLLLVLGGAVVTEAIGVHLVLGALVVSILIGRTRRGPDAITDSVTNVATAFFAPVFFAYTGLKVDLTSLDGPALAFGVLAVLVACVSKVVGGGLGAAAGGLPRWEALAVGFGLNARGAMELVIAAIGLSVGILNDATYAIVVLIAIVTTVMAAPTLKLSMDRAGPEARRRWRAGRDARAPADPVVNEEPPGSAA
jgi:Kef-type K+ transport system membrane component KefB